MKKLWLLLICLTVLIVPTKAQLSRQSDGALTFNGNAVLYYSTDTVQNPKTFKNVNTKISVKDTVVKLTRNHVTITYAVQPQIVKTKFHGVDTDKTMYFSNFVDKDGDDVLMGTLYSHQMGGAVIRFIRSKKYNDVYVIMAYSNKSIEVIYYAGEDK